MRYLFVFLASIALFAFILENDTNYIFGAIAFLLVAIFITLDDIDNYFKK